MATTDVSTTFKKPQKLSLSNSAAHYPHPTPSCEICRGLATIQQGQSSIAFGLPKAAVDGNVLRVISRITGDDRDITGSTVKKEVAGALESIYPMGRCGDFTQSLMELGAMICLPNGASKCEVCPLKEMCYANLHHCTDELPVKPEKKKRRIENLSVLVLKNKDCFAIQKRTAPGLLQGLWELPNLVDKNNPNSIQDFLKNHDISYHQIQKAGKAKHIFTHIEWQMTAYLVDCHNTSDSFRWVTREELLENVSLSSAFQHFSKLWNPGK